MSAADPRKVLYDLLFCAIIEIRGATGGTGPMPEEDRRFVFRMSNLVHNWPGLLCDATTDEDHALLLRQVWKRRGIADEWMRERLAFLGVDSTDLE